MITRQSAKSMIRSGVVVNKDYINSLKNADDVVDQVFNELEQRIKSLEAQLSNTEQLTCDRCKFWKDYRKCPMSDYENVSPKNYCYNFYPKDTK